MNCLHIEAQDGLVKLIKGSESSNLAADCAAGLQWAGGDNPLPSPAKYHIREDVVESCRRCFGMPMRAGDKTALP